MKLGIMQPYFFPYLGYWQLIKAVDKYIIYDDVNYIKNGWINRNNILLNDRAHLITVPLDGASPFKLIKDINITPNIKQREKILKTVEMAYKKAPYFEKVYPIVKSTLLDHGDNIAEALSASIRMIAKYLNIKTEIMNSSSIKKSCELKGQDKVLNICKNLGAKSYMNAIGGQELYCKNKFKDFGVNLSFLKMKDVEYKQFKNEFVPSLSIIDVLMFNSPEEVNKMLDYYDVL